MQPVHRIQELAPEYSIVYESPDPGSVYAYSPGIAVLPGGRLLATLDLSGPGIGAVPGPKRTIEWGKLWFGQVYTSDDDGRTWDHRADFPFMHARPFVAGDTVYVIGHCNDLVIMRSGDGGETWGEPCFLTEGQVWHQSACNVIDAKGNVYLVMERITLPGVKELRTHLMAPVLMRGDVRSDLTKRDAWTFASELTMSEALAGKENDLFGVPFFHEKNPRGAADVPPGQKGMYPRGWLETNVVQFTDDRHFFYDPSGRTFHLWMRANTGGTGYAAIAKAVEQEDGTIRTMLETVPSGKTMLFVPCPGGQMKFYILHDAVTGLYWLLSSQATDSMTHPDRLPPDRGSNPNNERHRLQLHFSRNCVDWCFAGLVAKTDSGKQARHYASMAISGDDLVILSRSGDERAASSHDGNLITFHRIRNFRELVY
ncbi:sialidase family protein [Paenibacillus sp. GCM10012303]|jgi:hypothetical protein|uniref:sialidase family protein n=1 Tax=Paenibacillus sp. GCM10012303 TaxID=3317340 RepID=UPI0036148B72